MKQQYVLQNKVTFADLSGSLKFAIVISWIMFGLTLFSFLVGFLLPSEI